MTSDIFWTGIIAMCIPGLFYFLRETIRDDIKISSTKPWRWGDKQRRAPQDATWGSHTALSVATIMLVIFAIGILKRI